MLHRPRHWLSACHCPTDHPGCPLIHASSVTHARPAASRISDHGLAPCGASPDVSCPNAAGSPTARAVPRDASAPNAVFHSPLHARHVRLSTRGLSPSSSPRSALAGPRPRAGCSAVNPVCFAPLIRGVAATRHAPVLCVRRPVQHRARQRDRQGPDQLVRVRRAVAPPGVPGVRARYEHEVRLFAFSIPYGGSQYLLFGYLFTNKYLPGYAAEPNLVLPSPASSATASTTVASGCAASAVVLYTPAIANTGLTGRTGAMRPGRASACMLLQRWRPSATGSSGLGRCVASPCSSYSC